MYSEPSKTVSEQCKCSGFLAARTWN